MPFAHSCQWIVAHVDLHKYTTWFHSFWASPVSINADTTEISPGWSDRQTAFQLYIEDDCALSNKTCCELLLRLYEQLIHVTVCHMDLGNYGCYNWNIDKWVAHKLIHKLKTRILPKATVIHTWATCQSNAPFCVKPSHHRILFHYLP